MFRRKGKGPKLVALKDVEEELTDTMDRYRHGTPESVVARARTITLLKAVLKNLRDKAKNLSEW